LYQRKSGALLFRYVGWILLRNIRQSFALKILKTKKRSGKLGVFLLFNDLFVTSTGFCCATSGKAPL